MTSQPTPTHKEKEKDPCGLWNNGTSCPQCEAITRAMEAIDEERATMSTTAQPQQSAQDPDPATTTPATSAALVASVNRQATYGRLLRLAATKRLREAAAVIALNRTGNAARDRHNQQIDERLGLLGKKKNPRCSPQANEEEEKKKGSL